VPAFALQAASLRRISFICLSLFNFLPHIQFQLFTNFSTANSNLLKQRISILPKLKPYLLLLVILLLAYLPLSTFHFGMKNDAFSDNFPNKFFFTEAIRSGHLPFWNPYLNFGFPIYADPGFAFWNPITWFFGAVVGYNAYTLTLEVLFYIYVAGVFTYRLGRYINFSFAIALPVAAMYMCCGFFVGEIQHINFITSGAFLPFLLHRFLVLFKQPNYKSAAIGSLALYVVVAGGHPAIPIATIYFLFTFTVSLFVLNTQFRENWKQILLQLSISVFLFILLYSPALYSYLTIFPDYARGVAVDQVDSGAINSGFSPSSFISFIYPFATVKNASFFTDDISMRNIYFSLTASALVITQIKTKAPLIRALFICAVVMLLLACGGHTKTIIYSSLPLLKFIRTNGEYRIFSILCFCLIAGNALSAIETNIRNSYKSFRKITILVFATSIIIILCTAHDIVAYFSHFGNLVSKNSIVTTKDILDNLSFTNVLFISAIINCIVIAFILSAKSNVKKLVLIIVIDLIVNSLFYLPFTGVGKVTLAEIQKTYNKSAKGIPIPPLVRLKNIDTLPDKQTGLLGSWTFYNKKVGTTKLTDYPSYFSRTESYFKSNWPATINNLPYIFLRNSIDSFENERYADNRIKVAYFSPQKIKIDVAISTNDSLVLLQNYHRFWKVKVDGSLSIVNCSFITFMSVPLTKGHYTVEFLYEDNWLTFFACVSIIAFIVVLVFMIFTTRPKAYKV
jgi:hypothetical protein